MKFRRLVTLTGTLLCVLILGSLLLGYVLGQPILLSYTESGSMEPSIEEGDGFIAVPTAVAGSPEPGDVIVFEAQEIDGGGLTTHRVIEETEHGYVTKGDGNFVSDQDSNEPYVTDGQVVAHAQQHTGDVVTIPHLGTVVMGVESRLLSVLGPERISPGGLSYLLLGIGFLTLALSAGLSRKEQGSRQRDRSRSRQDVFHATKIVTVLAVLICLITVVTMVAMSGTVEFGIVSAESDTGASHVITAGETENETYEIQSSGVLPTVTIVEAASTGIEADDESVRVARGESENVSMAVSAPPEQGYYLRSFGEYRYFGVLPTPVIETLHGIHPWVAMGTVTTVVVGIFVLPFAVLLGTGRIRTRQRNRTGARKGFLQ